MDDNNQYMQDLAIDPHALEDEWMRQPVLYLKYSDMAAQARREKDKLSETLNAVRAKLILDIRRDPKKYELASVTDTTVNSAAMMHEDFKRANSAVAEATYRVNMLDGAVRALDHKKKALENMVSLWMGSYFSGPREPKELKGGKRIIDMARDRIQDSAIEQAKELQEKRQAAAGKEPEPAPSAGAPVQRKRRISQ